METRDGEEIKTFDVQSNFVYVQEGRDLCFYHVLTDFSEWIN